MPGYLFTHNLMSVAHPNILPVHPPLRPRPHSNSGTFGTNLKLCYSQDIVPVHKLSLPIEMKVLVFVEAEARHNAEAPRFAS